MSYQRETIFESSLLSWRYVTLDAAAARWSDEYRVAGSRMLLPVSHCFGCRIAESTFVCDPGTALWLTPEDGYRLRRPHASQRSMLIELDADLGRSNRSSIGLYAHLKLRTWQRAWQAGRMEPLELEEELTALVTEHSSASCSERLPKRTHRAVEAAREYIASNPQRADTLPAIADAAHTSPFHLARVFRLHTGTSLHAYRTSLRMAAALERLQQGQSDLNTLAAELGYASHSHFTDTFKRSFGCTPRTVRTNLVA